MFASGSELKILEQLVGAWYLSQLARIPEYWLTTTWKAISRYSCRRSGSNAKMSERAYYPPGETIVLIHMKAEMVHRDRLPTRMINQL